MQPERLLPSRSKTVEGVMRGLFESCSACRWLAYIVPAAALAFSSSCGILDSEEENLADSVQVLVTGDTSTPLLLVTSTAWDYQIDQQTGEQVLRLFAADTADLSLPFDRTYPFTQSYRFLARVANTDTAQTATIRLRLVVGGNTVCDQTASLRDASFQCTWRYFF
jgi:hypothetical protein